MHLVFFSIRVQNMPAAPRLSLLSSRQFSFRVFFPEGSMCQAPRCRPLAHLEERNAQHVRRARQGDHVRLQSLAHEQAEPVLHEILRRKCRRPGQIDPAELGRSDPPASASLTRPGVGRFDPFRGRVGVGREGGGVLRSPTARDAARRYGRSRWTCFSYAMPAASTATWLRCTASWNRRAPCRLS